MDLSLKGLRLRLDREWPLKAGEVLEVEFRLDGKAPKWIQRRVVVRNSHGRQVGASFQDEFKNDPDVGFYLL